MAGLAGQTLDHYKLVEQVGQGGMATVFRAIDTRSQAEVAIKVLSPTITGDKRFVKRFRREAEIVKQHLKHPHIVPVIAYGQTQGMVYLVMPFIRGETLSDRLIRAGLTEREAALWIGQIADALQFAHRKGVIHRDIKPANIILTDSGEAMLSDFGLAREVEGSGTLTGSMLMGTPAFVSPEQAKGEKLDRRSDQYSLGVILYLISTGRLPFDSDSPMTLVLMHIQNRVPPPRQHNPRLQPAVERVILKCLAKSPDERFEDVASMAKAYQAAIAGDPLKWVEAPSEIVPGDVGASSGFRPMQSAEAPAARSGIPGWVLPVTIVPLVAIVALLALRPGAGGSGTEGDPIVLPPTQPQPQTTSTPAPPTPTSIPPTNVASDSCPGLELLAFRIGDNEVSWTMSNGTGQEYRLFNLGFGRPEGNPVTEVLLGGEAWLNEQQVIALETSQTPEVPEDVRTVLAPGAARTVAIRYRFGPVPQTGDLFLQLGFESTTAQCVLESKW
jgi:serine/threonine protein kinase